jgi:cyclopropane fatty-acyl-phospholipid synthase-like methyltransferase
MRDYRVELDYSLHYAHWHPDTPEHVSQMRSYFAQLLRPLVKRTDGIALDIGCAFGYSMLALKDLGFGVVEGVENSPQQAARARKLGLSVDLAADTSAWLRQRQRRYSTILLMDVLEHLPRENQIPLLAAINDSLTPGGCVVIQTPNANSPLATRYRYIDFTHYTIFTEHSLRFCLANAGFDSIEIVAEKGLGRPSLRFWRKTFARDLRRYLVRWCWYQVYKSELWFDDISQISFDLNLVAVAVKSQKGPKTGPTRQN